VPDRAAASGGASCHGEVHPRRKLAASCSRGARPRRARHAGGGGGSGRGELLLRRKAAATRGRSEQLSGLREMVKQTLEAVSTMGSRQTDAEALLADLRDLAEAATTTMRETSSRVDGLTHRVDSIDSARGVANPAGTGVLAHGGWIRVRESSCLHWRPHRMACSSRSLTRCSPVSSPRTACVEKMKFGIDSIIVALFCFLSFFFNDFGIEIM